MKITNKVKNKLTFNNSFEITSSTDLIRKYDLKKGIEIPNNVYINFLKDTILANSFYILKLSIKSKKALYNKLSIKYIDSIPKTEVNVRMWHQKIIDKVIDYLEKKKYLDDEDYIYVVITNYSHKSSKYIYYKLINDGISKEDIKKGFEKYQEILYKNEKKYLESFCELNRDKIEKDIKKYIAKLTQKGFKYSLIKEVFNKF